MSELLIYPAIDLKDGKCVRLAKGDLNQSTFYDDKSPVQQAKFFADSGAKWIHLIDLDGAFSGKQENKKIIESIISSVDISIQLGGGIRDIETIETWVKKGVKRVILGTLAVNQPKIVKDACREFPGKIGVGIDSRNGQVAIEGWIKASEINALDLAKRFEDAGVSVIIHTDIERDGVLMGPNLDSSSILAENVEIPLIISGGVRSIRDVYSVKRKKEDFPGISGLIVGRALYDGKLELSSALALLSE